ncbi:MAG: P-II family nitrogen regulator [Frankia sp.]
MKLVTAVIKPHRLDDVRGALTRFGVPGMTVSQVLGYGMEMWRDSYVRGTRHVTDLAPNIRVDILTMDGDAEDLVGVIRRAAHTGASGDGKIWVLPVEQVVRVRTGERGIDAV